MAGPSFAARATKLLEGSLLTLAASIEKASKTVPKELEAEFIAAACRHCSRVIDQLATLTPEQAKCWQRIDTELKASAAASALDANPVPTKGRQLRPMPTPAEVKTKPGHRKLRN